MLVAIGLVAEKLTVLIKLHFMEMGGLVVDNDPKAPPLTRVKLFVVLEDGGELPT